MQRSTDSWPVDEVLAVFYLRIAPIEAASGARPGDRDYVTRMMALVKVLAAEAGWSPEELVRAIRGQRKAPGACPRRPARERVGTR
jgi:hypothetical protein